MARPSDRSSERKLQVVLSVLRGELSAKEAARRCGVADQTVHNWKRALLGAGREGLAQGHRRRSSRELELEEENEELKAALGEAHVQLRVPKLGAEVSPLLRGPRDDPHRRRQQRLEVRGAGEGAPAHLPRPSGASARRGSAQGAVAGPGGGAASSLMWPSTPRRGRRGGIARSRRFAAADGHDVGSPSSVKRAMARRGLLQPARYHTERRQLAAARRAAFIQAPERRNRLWHADFT